MNYIIIFSILLFSVILIADDQNDSDTSQDKAENSSQPQDNDDAVMQAHRFFAADFFNKCWDYIDMPQRSPQEDLQMIHLAHASRAHWQAVGTPDNFAVGEWQISHVYAVLQRAEEALYYGQACLSICDQNQISGFNRGFALEAIARAYALMNQNQKAQEYIKLGKEEAKLVEIEEDKNYLLAELNNILN